MLDRSEDYHKGSEVTDTQQNSIPCSTNNFAMSFYIINAKSNFLYLSANAYGCRIELNTGAALAKPRFNSQPPQTIYSCTPANSSPQYEVHVLSVFEVINRRPPSAGDVTVNVVSRGRSDRLIILVLGSYEPVNWILSLSAGITISKVIVVSTAQNLKVLANEDTLLWTHCCS